MIETKGPKARGGTKSFIKGVGDRRNGDIGVSIVVPKDISTPSINRPAPARV